MIARRLGLETVGTFAVGFIAVTFVAAASPLGLISQLPRVRQPHPRLCFVALVLQLTQWPLLIPLLYIYAQSQRTSAAEAHVIYLVALNGPLLALSNIGITLSVMQGKERNALIAVAAESVGVVTATVAGQSAEALASCLLAGRACGVVLVWMRFQYARVSWLRMRSIARRGISYVAAEASALLADQIGPLALASVASRADLGIFRLCQQLLNAADAPVAAFVQAQYPSLVRAPRAVHERLLRKVTSLAAITAVLCLGASVALAMTAYHLPVLMPMMAVLSASLFWRYRVHLYEQALRAAGAFRMLWILNGAKPVVFAPIFLMLTSEAGAWGAIWAMLLLAVLVESAYGYVFRRQMPAHVVHRRTTPLPTPSPLVTVVIPAYNVGRFIEQAVASVLGQTYGSLEVIVINDGSTDDTAIRLSTCVDPRLRVIHQPNSGVSAARNAGMRQARGHYLAFLDGDDTWEPNLLDRLVTYLSDHPEADMAHAFARIVSEDGKDTGRTMACPPGPCSVETLLVLNVVNGSTVLARRNALQQAGEFDPTLPAAEDQDQWIRVALLRPNNIHCVPEVLASYRSRPGQTTRDWRTLRVAAMRVLEKTAVIAPALVSSVRREAMAHLHRYLGLVAFEAGDHYQARRFLAVAFRHVCLSLVLDRRTWFLVAAIGSRVMMPAALHRRLYIAYRRWQASRRSVLLLDSN